jgi:hypothetical protein
MYLVPVESQGALVAATKWTHRAAQEEMFS